jgi:hypothetical protein
VASGNGLKIVAAVSVFTIIPPVITYISAVVELIVTSGQVPVAAEIPDVG